MTDEQRLSSDDVLASAWDYAVGKGGRIEIVTKNGREPIGVQLGSGVRSRRIAARLCAEHNTMLNATRAWVAKRAAADARRRDS